MTDVPRDTHDRITQLLQAERTDPAEELLPLVYDQLRALAQHKMAHERSGHTLQPTALVHEAFLRVVGDRDPGWDGRRHFFAAAAEAMRRILINQARRKQQAKHGGGVERSDYDEAQLAVEQPGDQVLAVDEALHALEESDPRARQIVNLRYFTGLTTDETADALGISPSTVDREWRFIRAFLVDAIGTDDAT